MAGKEENKSAQDESHIPVFTVLKNCVILKNIFIVNSAQTPDVSEVQSFSSGQSVEIANQENEEMAIVGRHPDCNIMLTHPSISRFHLRIYSNSSLKKLSVMDLSSVHGTWVSDERIEPGVRVELKDGDTLRVGGSSRVYVLHWIPQSSAYVFEYPFAPLVDASSVQERERENAVIEEENSVETHQEKENSSVEEDKEVLLLDSILEDLHSLFSTEKLETDLMKLMHSSVVSRDDGFKSSNPYSELTVMEKLLFPIEETPADIDDEIKRSHSDRENQLAFRENHNPEPVIGKDMKDNLVEEEIPDIGMEEKDEIPEDSHPTYAEISAETENRIFYQENKAWEFERERCESCTESSRSDVLDNLDCVFIGGEKHITLADERSEKQDEENDYPSLLSPLLVAELVDLSSPELRDFLEVADNKESQTPRSFFGEELSEDHKFETSIVGREEDVLLCKIGSRSRNPTSNIKNKTGRSIGNVNTRIAVTEENKENSRMLFSHLEEEEDEIFTPDKENFTPSFCLEKSLRKKVNDEKSTSKSVYSKIMDKETSILGTQKTTPTSSIWSRRGKSTSNIKVQTSRSLGKVNTGANVAEENGEEVGRKLISRMPFSHLYGEEDEIFTPDKENFTPNTLLQKSLRRKGKSKSISSKIMDKENQASMILQDTKFEANSGSNGGRLGKEKIVMKKQIERMPFQSLLNSTGKNSLEAAVLKKPFTCTHAKKAHDKYHLQNNHAGNGKRNWTMVADITSLVDDASMKSLQLLQGLKGTQLIIPRMVINELDCLKRCGNFFRRTAKASSVLEWIEECMVKTKWWIHVQSTVEDGTLIAPTPPVSPQIQFSEGMTIGYSPFITRGNFMEIVSPTAEDHILDCALRFKKTQDDGQIVLLSNDLTLKIKAMAEGLICERAEEFRDSLVNPFSSRFLWAGSSPRGLTWSGLYDNCPLKKSFKGGNAKGLKLILLHNSHYGRFDPTQSK